MIIGRHLILVIINKSRTYRTKKVESRKMKKKSRNDDRSRIKISSRPGLKCEI